MGIRLRALSAWLLSLSLLAGCATTVVQEGEPGTRPAQDTVAREAMQFTDVPLGTAVTVTIDAKSPSCMVDGIPRRFASFSLPDGFSRRYLDFVSLPHGDGWTIYKLKTLVPVFTFLDVDRQVIVTTDSGRMENRRLFGGNRFEGRVAVPARSRYVIVHGTEQAPGPLIVHGDPGYMASIPGSRLGSLTLTLSNVGMARVTDTGLAEDSSKAKLFYLASVDGIRVYPNAASESRFASSGAGMNLRPQFPSRLVPVKPLKVIVVGTHATGAPIHELASRAAGTFWSVEAELDFAPEIDKTYVVKGNLQTEGSTVWIEDAATGQPVTKKGTSSDRPGGR